MLSLRLSFFLAQYKKSLHFVRFGSFKNITIINPSANFLPWKGIENGKKPIKTKLKSGQIYSYCACGLSTSEPWCDKKACNTYGFTNLRNIDFSVDTSGEYFLCTCKHTDKRPLCDGAHKSLSQKPNNEDATELFAASKDTAVYEGYAKELGYITKNGGFQK